MGDYNSVVYCIRCNLTNECYIGSTFKSIEERLKKELRLKQKKRGWLLRKIKRRR